MKEYITSIMNSDEHGLYLCELPTGYGKTYNVAHVIREYLNNPVQHKKIIYLTTLNKNLLNEDLLKAFDNDEEEYNRNVLRIRSNFDEVTEKLEKLDVPEEFRTDSYYQLLKLVQRYNSFEKSKIDDQDYIQDVKNRLEGAERTFRREVSKSLKKNFKNKRKRLKAIRMDSKWQWIGRLYPAVFTDDYQVLLMSISKFMKRNSCLVEPSYEFLKSDIIDDAIIFIDEFDATKATIKDEIIEGALSIREEYLSLFRQILRGLNPSYLSRAMTDAYKHLRKEEPSRYRFERIYNEAKEIDKKYAVYLSYKTVEDNIERKQNFLFKDATYHTILRDNKRYIRAAKNNKENRVDIFFETGSEFYSNIKANDEENIVVYALLREINRFLIHFRTFLFVWARQYMKDINEKRAPEDDELTLDNAISTILDKFELSYSGRQLVLSEMRCSSIARQRKELLPDNSFYQCGMEVFEFEDQDAHYDETNLKLVAVYDTPEKILTYLSEKSLVIGISATAEIPSVVGNYDLEHLKEHLGDQFHTTPDDLTMKISDEMEKNWEAYNDGRVKIHAEKIKDEVSGFDIHTMCGDFFHNEDLGNVCANIICNTTESEYHEIRYCNLALAMHRFCTNDIQSMLYLGMALPKRNNPEFDVEILKKIFELVIRDAAYSGYMDCEDLSKERSLYILNGSDYDKAKEGLVKRLNKGEKIFIMSSYQTIGAGQNLQYEAPNKSELVELTPYLNDGDKRHFAKDIDAIYLGEITHLTTNTYSNERITETGLMKMLFQIEELRQHSELNYEEFGKMTRLAFRAYTGQSHMERNILYRTESVKLQATRQVMQAVGRMCRTFLKSKDIYIYIEERLLDKLSAGELKKHILPPEMKEIVRLREELGAEYTDEEAKLLRKAEKISSYGMWDIKQLLSNNWTEDSMALWIAMRHLTLCHPTCSSKLCESNELLHKLYITSGKPQQRYLYSQYSDFSNVVIDFAGDKIAFRNSGRAKRNAENNEVIVCEMSEQESRLPIMMKYPGLKEFFEESGYATKFCENDYMMSPVLFHNIYKGALGEVAGRYILKKELGIELSEITDPERFEFFDYEMSPGVYVDFKNWKFNYLVNRGTVKKEIIKKLDEIGGKRAYIIKVVGDETEYMPPTQIDSRIVEIPCLIDMQGCPVRKYIHSIKEEDF
ncbi:MAG: hypothetical protein K5644_09745 [Lachnospiraceae bacterium]|nr:hypothetical protein [Lachnospiraceae bacterium]